MGETHSSVYKERHRERGRKMSSRLEELQSIVEPVVEKLGLELVDLEYKKIGGNWFLRVFIDGPDGISHRECTETARTLNPILDLKDPIPHSYTLEVSSPGLDRPLRKEKDFEKFVGKQIVAKTYEPWANRRVFRGQLLGLVAGAVAINLEGGEKIEIPLDKLAQARLEVEI